MCLFRFPPFSIEIKKHHKDAMVFVYDDSEKLDMIFGITHHDGKVYYLKEHVWYEIKNINGALDMVKYIFEKNIPNIDLTDYIKSVLSNTINNKLKDIDTELPDGDFFSFYGENKKLRPHYD